MSNFYLSPCPRCGTRAYENLASYGHCVECLYVEDRYFDMETAYHQARRIERELDERPTRVFELPKKKAFVAGAAS